MFDIRDYGAQHNTDCTEAIQSAIQAANNAGGGTVLIPHGTWLITRGDVSSFNFPMVELLPGINIEGFDRDTCILKLADNQGNYYSMIGQKIANALTSPSLRNFTIDGNNENNSAEYEDEDEWLSDVQPRIAIYLSKATNSLIENVRFANHDSINTLVVSGLSSGTTIRNNLFQNIGDSPIDHDHSTIYTHCNNQLIENNVFEGAYVGALGARTAIETHGSRQIVRYNSVTNFEKGMNITGVAVGSDGIEVYENEIQNANYGISLWSLFYAGNTTNPAMRYCRIFDNDIYLTPDPWEQITCYGIGLADTDSPIHHLTISNNRIYLEWETREGSTNDNLSAGIILVDHQPDGIPHYDWTIENNLIGGTLGPGIRLSLHVDQLKIIGNHIIDPAQLPQGVVVSGYLAGIFVYGDNSNVLIDQNVIEDSTNLTKLSAGIYFQNDQTLTNCVIKTNKIIANNLGALYNKHTSVAIAGTLITDADSPYILRGDTIWNELESQKGTPAYLNQRSYQKIRDNNTTYFIQLEENYGFSHTINPVPTRDFFRFLKDFL